MTRLSRAGWVRFPHSPASAGTFTLVLLAALATPLAAQQLDTLRAPVAQIRPISPGGAFVQSLLIPGRGQITLGKKNASRFYFVVEALGIGMTIKSFAALREAKRGVGDSIPVAFEVDPVTGDSVPTEWTPGRFTPERVNARRTHVEDWIALIIFNHLLSAADAYVAANLWDFPASVSVNARPSPAGPQSGRSGWRPSPLGLEARITGSIAW